MNEHIDDLIGKILSGEASPAEKLEVETWASLREENQRYFRQFSVIYEKAGPDTLNENFNVDAAWKKVSETIRPEGRLLSFGPSTKSILSWRIAAAVMVLMAVGTLVFLMFNEEKKQFTYQATDVVMKDTLPDGSKATLNKKSSLSFNFDDRSKMRKATLQGEAFFEVLHDESSAFIIESNDVFIRDIGTAFNVRSLEGSDSVVVFVKEGEVEFYTSKNTGIHLLAGEQGVYVRSSGTFSKSEQEDVNAASYADRQFRFRNAPMKRVLKKINEVYSGKLMLENPVLEECRITVNFDDDELDVIASVIAETMGWKVSEETGVYLLQGENCQE